MPACADILRRILPAAGVLLAGSGCVQIYQPITGLHRPVVVDIQAANFRDVRLTIYCMPGDLLTPSEASVLCQKVGTLFENQGAEVQTVAGARQWAGDDALSDRQAATPEESLVTADLIMELRSRKVQEYSDPLLETLCVLTSTLVPMVRETVFAQDVTIRDASGFLLVSDTLQGRLITRIGAGAWVGNRFMNVVWRRGDEKLTEEAVGRDLSADLYGQLSQLTFNAKMQWRVLQEAAPSPEGTSWR